MFIYNMLILAKY